MSGQSKNHTLKGGTSPYSLCMGVPPGYITVKYGAHILQGTRLFSYLRRSYFILILCVKSTMSAKDASFLGGQGACSPRNV